MPAGQTPPETKEMRRIIVIQAAQRQEGPARVLQSAPGPDAAARRCLLTLRPPQTQPVLLSPFLVVAPPGVEAQYWARFRAFDLVNCVIPILYFGKVTLSTWFTPALLAVYSSVLALKLLHAGLLLRAPGACLRWRRAILWTERVVRTLVSVRVVAYGKTYRVLADGTSRMYAARVLLLNSGFTISCWNAFCLPLDFPSQVMLTGVFVLSTLPGALHEVHSILEGPVAALPPAVWLHARLRAGGALLGRALLQGSLAPPPWPPAGAPGGGGAAAAGAALAPGPASLGEEAALLSAVLSCAYVLFVCGVVPLWVAYHLERVHKQQWLRSHPRLLWLNPPPASKAGQWPPPGAAAAQLGGLLLAALAAAEVCVAMWGWLAMPVWAGG
ncbi:MAG: hypothetical protein J3K34DRAFT_480228 [Monoraphidium minutum]|nr:MAG: hypothetical protein J3K34DRAFT_480228 [Monoraphidium minutum]